MDMDAITMVANVCIRSGARHKSHKPAATSARKLPASFTVCSFEKGALRICGIVEKRPQHLPPARRKTAPRLPAGCLVNRLKPLLGSVGVRTVPQLTTSSVQQKLTLPIPCQRLHEHANKSVGLGTLKHPSAPPVVDLLAGLLRTRTGRELRGPWSDGHVSAPGDTKMIGAFDWSEQKTSSGARRFPLSRLVHAGR